MPKETQHVSPLTVWFLFFGIIVAASCYYGRRVTSRSLSVITPVTVTVTITTTVAVAIITPFFLACPKPKIVEHKIGHAASKFFLLGDVSRLEDIRVLVFVLVGVLVRLLGNFLLASKRRDDIGAVGGGLTVSAHGEGGTESAVWELMFVVRNGQMMTDTLGLSAPSPR